MTMSATVHDTERVFDLFCMDFADRDAVRSPQRLFLAGKPELGNKPQHVEKRRYADDNRKGSKGGHEDGALRDALPRLSTRGRDICVLRGRQCGHDGDGKEGRTSQPEQQPDRARDRRLHR